MKNKMFFGLITLCIFASACCSDKGMLIEENIDKKERVIQRELIVE
ncbi:MAG: hypothetical protein HRT88_03420 [Lentisphaeraceae bacterium]|nr:hypothetical protein [Lentisphaeraceae bacterium]